MPFSKALLHGAHGPQALQMRIADSFLTRFAGLMFQRPLAPQQGLLITRCSSVHSAWMRGAIDLAYLNAAGRITRCVTALKPWRVSIGPRGTVHTLELAAGSIERFALTVGDRLEHPHLMAAASA